MREFLWIGSYLNEENFKYYQKLGYKNASSYVSQKNIIEGLKKIGNINFDSLNMITFKGYPYDKTIYINQKVFDDAGNKNCVVGYLNILYLNKIFGSKSLEKQAKIWVNENSVKLNDGLDIFVYEMRSACLNAAILIKNAIPNSKIHLIVPDLPMFMDLKMSLLKQGLKKIDWFCIKKQLAYVDDYILYTESMASFLELKHKPWLLMEGSINIKELDKNNSKSFSQNNKFIVMYSGNIDKEYGIVELINAFDYLDEQYELWITGGGKYSEELHKICSKNPKIKFFGFLPNRRDLLSLQEKASAFINIRNPKIVASNYVFPSKLFEYMLTGKPVITCELAGIPSEYYKYLIKFQKLEPKEISKTIKKIAKMPDKYRTKMGNDAQKFICENKNNYVQAKKILEFIGYKNESMVINDEKIGDYKCNSIW